MVVVIYLHRLVASQNDFQITKDARGKGEIRNDFLVNPSAPLSHGVCISLFHPCSAPSFQLTSCITHSFLLERLRGGGGNLKNRKITLDYYGWPGLARESERARVHE
jgi:hypothetical protein